MKYFKNKELANIYHVSEKSVRNWINSSLEGKLDLQLFSEGNKVYIANTTKNVTEIEGIVEKGRKYKNSRSHREIRPQSEFYKLFSDEQIFDIIQTLERHNEIQYKYCHVGPILEQNLRYYQRLLNEDFPNSFQLAKKFLENSKNTFEDLLESDSKINIVEIGGRDGQITKGLVSSFKNKDRLNKYIDIDISQDMINILIDNYRDWFSDKIIPQTFARDIGKSFIDDVLFKYSNHKNQPYTQNLVFFLAGTLYNLIDPEVALRNIQKSLSKNDFFIMTHKPDSNAARRYFDFSPKYNNPIPLKERLLADSLGIDESMYEAEMIFDKNENSRLINFKFKVSIKLIFEFKNYYKELNFEKGDIITFWRSWHFKPKEVLDQLDRTGFDVLHSSRTKNNESMITISRIK